MTEENSELEASPKAGLPPHPMHPPHGAHGEIPSWVTLAGWYGVFAIFAAYFFMSTGSLDNHLLYQLLNGTGALGLTILCFKKRTWQPFALNLAWLTIALYAIWKLIF